jgi:hypothetical protein
VTMMRIGAAAFKPQQRTNSLPASCRSTSIRNAGATTLQAITQALNQRGIRAARGARWCALPVMNVVERGKALRESLALL